MCKFCQAHLRANSLCLPDCNRVAFFKKQLLTLVHASSDGYHALLDACKECQALIDHLFPSIPVMNISQYQSHIQTLPTDMYSKSILPEEWKHVCPMTCYGDGNCLYRYVH